VNQAIVVCVAVLLAATRACAQITATIKCDAKSSPPQSYVGIGPDLLEAIKSAVAKAEREWRRTGGCYSIDVKPKLRGMFGCTTKSC
jgi:hypothetical protein